MTRPADRSRAVELLRKIIATNRFERADLADNLGLSKHLFDAYEAAERPMPLEHQRGLAVFVIEHVPSLVRHGYRLRGQVIAALAFEQSVTQTHNSKPPGAGWQGSLPETR